LIVEHGGHQSIAFGPEADGFEASLAVLCDGTPAVTLLLRSGARFGAVLSSVHDGVLIYEHWDEEAGQPSGEPGTVEIEEIDEVQVE